METDRPDRRAESFQLQINRQPANYFINIVKWDIGSLTGAIGMVKIRLFKQKRFEIKINLKESNTMIELTDPAKTQINDYFQGREPTPIRIFLNSGG